MHADKRQSFYKLVLSFVVEMARHVQNTQNKTLVIFLQCIQKNCRNCFACYCDAKHSDILQGSSHVGCYLLYLVFIARNYSFCFCVFPFLNSKALFFEFKYLIFSTFSSFIKFLQGYQLFFKWILPGKFLAYKFLQKGKLVLWKFLYLRYLHFC